MKIVVLTAAIGISLVNGAYALVMFNGTSPNSISMNGTGLNLVSFNGASTGTSGSAPATIDLNALRVVRAVTRH